MTAPLALRLTVHGHHLDAADRLADTLPLEGRYSGLVLSRNDVIRLAIGHGLAELERTTTTKGAPDGPVRN